MNVIETKTKRWFPEGTGLVIGPTIGLLMWLFGFAMGWFLSPYILGAFP